MKFKCMYNSAMIYDFDHPPERRSSECFKWQTYADDVLPMWVADMDFPAPQPVIDALMERVQHGVYGYPRGLKGEETELPELRSIITERLAHLYGWEVQPDALVFLPGTHVAFNLACHAVAAPGGVLIQTPVYPPINQAALATGSLHQEMELNRLPDGSYSVDWDDFEAAITPETRLFLFCNPHNPVGRVFRKDELEQMASACLSHDLIICSDEVHCELVYPGQYHLPIASLAPEIADRTITLMAPSKTFNLAGLQFSFAVIQNPALRKRFLSARKGLVPWAGLMGLVAAAAAYKHGQEWLDQLMIYLAGNRDTLVDYAKIELPGIQVSPAEGTYLAWLDCRGLGLNSSPYEFFLRHAKVALNDGKTFGTGGEGFVRLNFGCSRQVLLEGLSRMKHALLNNPEHA